MKLTKLITISIALLLMIVAGASAATYTNIGPASGNYELHKFYDSNGNAVSVTGYMRECTDDNCDAPATNFYYMNTDANGVLLYTYPHSDSPKDYAAYAYADGYVSREWTRINNWNPDGIDRYKGTYEGTFTKLEGCRAPMSSFSLNYYDEANKRVRVGEPITVAVKTKIEGDIVSAFVHYGQPPFMIPAPFQDWYDADTDVTLKVYDPSGAEVYSETKSLKIIANREEQVEFTWTPAAVGAGFSAVVSTSVTDEMCNSGSTSSETWMDTFSVVNPDDELCFTSMQNMEFSDDFPKVGDALTVSFDRLSNYRNLATQRFSIGTSVTMDVTKDGASIAGYPKTENFDATGNVDVLSSSTITWTPQEEGEYTITISGIGNDARCASIQNDPRIISQTKYVSPVPAHSLTVTVTDGNSFVQLPGVQVRVFGNGYYDQTLATDASGKQVFSGLRYGDYTYVASAAGYSDSTGDISIGNGDATKQIFMYPTGTNYLPVIDELPDKNLVMGITDSTLNLDDYVQDNDDADSLLIWSVTASSVTGISIDPVTHVVTFTPTAVGAEEVTFTVTDQKGGQDSDTILVTVSATNNPPALSGIPDVSIVKNTQAVGIINLESYASDLETSVDALTYEITSADTSATCGVSISSYNMIDVDPALDFVGACDITVRVTDQGGLTAEDTFTVTVTDSPADNHNPIFTSAPVTEAVIGESYFYDANAVDADGDTIQYSLAQGPTGMTINTANGVIRWTPSNLGSYAVTVLAFDGRGGFAFQRYSIVVSQYEVIEGEDNLMIARLRVASGDYVDAGNDIAIAISLENVGSKDLENLKVTASIPELGIVRSIGPFDLNDGENSDHRLSMKIPASAANGKYAIRIVVSNDNLRRVTYRDVKVR